MITRFLKVTLLLLLFSPLFAEPVEIDITQGTFQPIPLCILFGTSFKKIEQVVHADLLGSGVFKGVDHTVMPQSVPEVLASPLWQSWQQTGGQILLVADVREQGSEITIHCHVLDLFNNQETATFMVTGDCKNWRRLAHQISDRVYKQITGFDGYFDSRITYVARLGHCPKESFRIAQMDADGANHDYFKIKGHLLKKPQFSSTGQKLLYVANKTKKTPPQAFVFDLESQTETKIATGGKVFAARFSHAMDQFLLSVLKKNQTTLGFYGLGGTCRQPLVQRQGIDTSPSFSKDHDFFVFISNRGGSAQLYRLSSTGGEPERLTWNPGKYFTPACSPSESKVVFVKQNQGFFLGTLDLQTGQEKVLTSYYLIDTPAWAPGGQAIVFSAREGRNAEQKLYVLNTTSLKVQKLHTQGTAFEPTWSPLS